MIEAEFCSYQDVSFEDRKRMENDVAFLKSLFCPNLTLKNKKVNPKFGFQTHVCETNCMSSKVNLSFQTSSVLSKNSLEF